MTEEEAAEEYYRNLKGDKSEKKFAKIDFKAGFQSGKSEGRKELDFKTQVAYESGRTSMKREIVDKLKQTSSAWQSEGNFQAAFLLDEFLTDLENL